MISTSFDSTSIINEMREMSFTSRETAQAADIFERMVRDKESTIYLLLQEAPVRVDVCRFMWIWLSII